MRILLLFAFLIPVFKLSAQENLSELSEISMAEQNSAAATMGVMANQNTQNYDVIYQRLQLNVDPAVYFISGDITTHYTAQSPMNSITFDLATQLTVGSVMQGETPLSFTQSNNELVIQLSETLQTGQLDSLTVSYAGVPPSGEQAFATSTHSGTPILWTLSQPYGARDWWPCKQDLNDKIENIDIYLTAPSQYVSVANGVEISQTTNGNGTKTTHFRHNYPIPAYLVAIAVTNYSIYTQQAGSPPNQFPIVNYIYPENYNSAVNSLAQTIPIMNLFEELFETYPYADEKYGHAQFGWGGGMEHTTVSFMGNFSRGLIAHELAHQWFGNKITCGTWKDIWLNEGFAAYLSGLVVENLDGNNNFITWKNNIINNITSQPGGYLYLQDSDLTNVNRIFSSRLSYNKAAMVLHMLRWKLGDEDFFQACRNYLADPNLAFGYAVTDDLKFHLEAESGTDLTEFFDNWVYKQGYPRYTITASNIGNNQVQIQISQTQSHSSVSFFKLPVPVRLTGSNNSSLDVVLDNTFNNQTFVVDVPFTVTDIEFDPERHLISRNNTATLGTGEFAISNNITLYPNPVSQELYINVPDYVLTENIAVINMLGQIVISQPETYIDVKSLPEGVYTVQIDTNNGTFYKKFIKK